MIHHVSVGSTDIQRSRAFYDPLMSLIGFRLIKVSDTSLHYGAADIAFSIGVPLDGRPASPGNGVHIAFQAPDRETVRQFHQIALANGGADEGARAFAQITMTIIMAPSLAIQMETRFEAVTYTARESF